MIPDWIIHVVGFSLFMWWVIVYALEKKASRNENGFTRMRDLSSFDAFREEIIKDFCRLHGICTRCGKDITSGHECWGNDE